MIQLTYEPSLDPYHTVFRFLRLRPIVAEYGPMHKDHARILDFYQLLPFRISEIRLLPQHRRFRSLSASYEKPYGEQPESRLLFQRMEPIQVAALDTLANHNVYSAARWQLNELSATDEAVPTELAARLHEINEEDPALESFLKTLAADYRLSGIDGLKHRTGLLEHRHDAI